MFAVENYELDPNLYYDPQEHFWVKVGEGRARIGFDPLVQESLGALVVVQLEATQEVLSRGDSFGTIEAEKYVGPLRAPVSGVITSINQAVIQNPRLAGMDPYGQGWFIEVKLSNFADEEKLLVTGEDAVKNWFEQELRKYKEEGWLAES